MDWEKYNKVPEEFATAKEIGLAAATLGAMVRRGFVETLDTSPKQYRRVNNPSIQIYKLYEEKNKPNYFTLFKKNKQIGMLCSMSGNDIIDCWGKPYDLSDVCRIEIKNISYQI